MRKRLTVFVVMLVVVLTVGFGQPVMPSEPTPEQKDFLEQVAEQAISDAENKGAIDNAALDDFYADAQEEELGLSRTDIRTEYETAFYARQKTLPPDRWQPIRDSMTPERWIIGILLLLFAGVNDASRKWIGAAIEKTGEWFYVNVWAGNPLAETTSLRRYQKSLLRDHAKLKIPFRLNRTLEMAEVYVPLKVGGSQGGDQLEARKAVDTHQRLMVTGPPGSGKSILLRKLTLDYASQQLIFDNRVIPVLLPLHRLSAIGTGLTVNRLVKELIQVFDENGFLKAEHFVQKGLEKGRFILLFDGLDEVNSSVRSHVADKIREFLRQEKYQKCRSVITCRTAVYSNEFFQVVDQTLEIVEFSDQQLRQFLSGWKSNMPQGKTVERLLAMLKDRPRIKQLARNPLLMTIIAYLYCDTPFVLPQSRTEFYDKATDVLLDQWQKEKGVNQYKAVTKAGVLKYLALQNQDRATPNQKDRRSVDYPTLLNTIKSVLPSLGRDPEADVEPVLTEIVERSGLLKPDGEERYQFAHLTLQEYFAAAALRNDSAGLIQRFQHDPAAWREVVKLWCGLAEDSTAVVKAVYAVDPVTGFECLADVQQIDSDRADEIVTAFLDRFQQANLSDAEKDAFSIVASDERPHGQVVFQHLVQQLRDSNSQSTNVLTAAVALAKTNLPRAAEELIQHDENPVIDQALISMGDVAVPIIKQQIETLLKKEPEGGQLKHSAAYNRLTSRLVQIGTPDTSVAILDLGLLWLDKPASSVYRIQAAWCLAALLPKPGVEEMLNQYELPSRIRPHRDFTWVWKPFEPTQPNGMNTIASHIVAQFIATDLSASSSLLSYRNYPPDPRVILPATIGLNSFIQLPKHLAQESADTLDNLQQTGQQSRHYQTAIDLILQETKALGSESYVGHWSSLIQTLPPEMALKLLAQLLNNKNSPKARDWIEIFKQFKYQFAQSWHYWTVVVITLGLSVSTFLGIGWLWIDAGQATNANLLNLSVSVIGELAILTFWLTWWQGIEQPREPSLFLKLGIQGIKTFFDSLRQIYTKEIQWLGIKKIFQILDEFNVLGAVFFAMVFGFFLGIFLGFFVESDLDTTVDITYNPDLKWTLMWAWGLAWGVPWGLAKTVARAAARARVWTTILAVAATGVWVELLSGIEMRTLEAAVALLVIVFGWIGILSPAPWDWIWTLAWSGAWVALGSLSGDRTLAWSGAVTGAVIAGAGLGFWDRAKENPDSLRFLAIFAFPLFCSAPAVLIYNYQLLDRFLPWYAAITILASIVGICTGLWQWGKLRERQASNPLRGLLNPADYGITVEK